MLSWPVLNKSYMKLHIQKRTKALNPAFKRFQNLPPVAAAKPPGQFAMGAAVRVDRAILDARGTSPGAQKVPTIVQRLASPCCMLSASA